MAMSRKLSEGNCQFQKAAVISSPGNFRQVHRPSRVCKETVNRETSSWDTAEKGKCCDHSPNNNKKKTSGTQKTGKLDTNPLARGHGKWSGAS